MYLISNIQYFYKRKIEPGFRVGKDANVLDIGSGDKPFWRADVFLDKLSLGDNQRTSQSSTIHDIGRFVDGDVNKMPFKDKEFDFSFCSHLLEHVDDPARVIKEIIRVSKRGYIEVPNGILETIAPFDTHLWFVFYDNKKLIFFRKSKIQHDRLTNNGLKYMPLLGKIEEPFIRIYWKNNIEFEVINDYSLKDRFVSPVKKAVIKNKSQMNGYILLVKILRLFLYKRKSN